MRNIVLYYCTLYTDGTRVPNRLEINLDTSAVKQNALLEDGRKIVRVEKGFAYLDDDEKFTVEAALWGVLPDLTGMVFPGLLGNRVVLAGPDNTGKILFEDEGEAYLFGTSANPTNPFHTQRDSAGYGEALRLDRELREQSGRLVPSLAKDPGPDGDRLRQMAADYRNAH